MCAMLSRHSSCLSRPWVLCLDSALFAPHLASTVATVKREFGTEHAAG